MKSATSEGILKQKTDKMNSASRKSTGTVEFGIQTTTKAPASQAPKGGRAETPKTFLGSIGESGNLGASLNKIKVAS